MMRRFSTLTALAVAGLATACGETQQQVPTASPSFASARVDPTACSFSGMNSATAKFFSSSAQQKTVKGLESTMQAAWSAADTNGARNAGYDIFREIAAAVQAGAVGTVSSGSDLTNQVTACMFFSTAERPADFPHDYTTELTPSAPGAFAVRGGSADSTGAVLARGASPLSGLGPQVGSTWSQITSTNPAPSRVLFYGQPSALPFAYDWKAIPANARFAPALIVGLCDPGQTYMVFESNGNILPYIDAYFLAGPCPTAAGSLNIWQRSLALGQRVVSGLLPAPLDAAALNPGGLGGLSKGFSTFSTYNVGTVLLTYTTQPHDATVLPSDVCPATPIGAPYNVGPVTFRVTKDGIAVGGTAVSIAQVNNNGTPTTLCGNIYGVTDGDGYLTLDGIGVTKTGGYVFVAAGTVPGRNITSSGGTSDHFNIRP